MINVIAIIKLGGMGIRVDRVVFIRCGEMDHARVIDGVCYGVKLWIFLDFG